MDPPVSTRPQPLEPKTGKRMPSIEDGLNEADDRDDVTQ